MPRLTRVAVSTDSKFCCGCTHACGGALPGNLTFTAQQGDKGLVLRVVNKGRAPLALTVKMKAGACLLPGVLMPTDKHTHLHDERRHGSTAGQY